jgi:hypothetical protein
MKKLWILLAAIAVAVLFSNCNLPGAKTSISDRINQFMKDINDSSRSNVSSDLDITSLAYSQVTASYWNTPFPTAGIPYSLSSTPSTSDVTTTINSSYALFVGGLPIIFGMATDISGNAVIHSITLGGAKIFD